MTLYREAARIPENPAAPFFQSSPTRDATGYCPNDESVTVDPEFNLPQEAKEGVSRPRGTARDGYFDGHDQVPL